MTYIVRFSWFDTHNLHSFTPILTHHLQTITHNTRKSDAHVYYILIAVVNYYILCHIHNIMYTCCCYCDRTCIYPTTLLSFVCCQYVSYQYIGNAQNICCWARRMSFIHSFIYAFVSKGFVEFATAIDGIYHSSW